MKQKQELLTGLDGVASPKQALWEGRRATCLHLLNHQRSRRHNTTTNRFDLDGHRPRCPLPPFCVPFWRGGEPPFVSFSTYLILCCLVLGMCVHFSRSPGGKNEKARISQCAYGWSKRSRTNRWWITNLHEGRNGVQCVGAACEWCWNAPPLSGRPVR